MTTLPDEFFIANRKLIDGKKVMNLVEISEKIIPQYLKQFLMAGYTEAKAEETFMKQIDRDINVSNNLNLLLCANNWYAGGRQIYSFDDDLAKCLESQQEKDLEISADVLKNLPCDNFYIKTKSSNEGFIFCIIEDRGQILITIAELSDKGKPYSYMIDVCNGKTISQCYMENIKYLCNTPKMINYYKNFIIPKILRMLQFIVYLSAINAEIVPITKNSVVKRTAKNSDIVIRKQRTQIASVGYKFGSDFRKVTERKVYENLDTNADHHGTKKSPHIRRSHFHSFWIGSGEDKKIVVKWVHIIFVHGGNSDITTIHKVK